MNVLPPAEINTTVQHRRPDPFVQNLSALHDIVQLTFFFRIEASSAPAHGTLERYISSLHSVILIMQTGVDADKCWDEFHTNDECGYS